jgi:hypothetical protein
MPGHTVPGLRCVALAWTQNPKAVFKFLRVSDPRTQMEQMILLNVRMETQGLGGRESYLRGLSDIRAAKAADLVMKAFPEAPAPREEETEHITGVLSRDDRGTRCLGLTLILLTATFGDCLIRAHYKHQVTFARS